MSIATFSSTAIPAFSCREGLCRSAHPTNNQELPFSRVLLGEATDNCAMLACLRLWGRMPIVATHPCFVEKWEPISMAVSSQFRDYVLDQLAQLGPLDTKHLFGGLSVRCAGQHFGAILNGVFYLVADVQLRTELEELGGTPFSYARAERTIEVGRFISVPENVLEDIDTFLPFARRSLQIAERDG
ncbi:TfoX/Sxy family protein [Breoghania sp.]|uniref:TfoX/Sxy family protein n=1 Tax=Breoghania sp. TaxID=2065378 RepID=UPI002AA91A78|nr:TfoX/Sxy family protein [Breoghania sp.]